MDRSPEFPKENRGRGALARRLVLTNEIDSSFASNYSIFKEAENYPLIQWDKKLPFDRVSQNFFNFSQMFYVLDA